MRRGSKSSDLRKDFVDQVGPKMQVFISYRREDSAAAAEHLHASLAQRLGGEAVFRDVATIEPGQDFFKVIEEAIRQSTALIALIGRTWLTSKGHGGRRRLDDPKDYVRREIETALAMQLPVIPVLVDDARMPTRGQLPRSIAELAGRNAYTLPWYQGIARLERRIQEIARERAVRDEAMRIERDRLDLMRGRRVSRLPRGGKNAAKSFNVITRAMEMSLAYQGRRVTLDPASLVASLKKINPSSDGRWFVFPDLIYAIDVLGVKAKQSPARFVARSYPLHRLDEIPAHLQQGRPVLSGITIFDSWNREPAVSTGFVDGENPGHIVITMVGAIIGWDPAKRQARVQTPETEWGDRGVATLTEKAMAQSIDKRGLRSIEVVPMSVPLTPISNRSTTARKSGGKSRVTKPRGR